MARPRRVREGACVHDDLSRQRCAHGPRPLAPAYEELAARTLERFPCARQAGDGIFYASTGAGGHYDASGTLLFGPDRPRLDWYDVRVAPNGAISVDLSAVHRASWSDAHDAGVSTPTPVPRGALPRPDACP
jgi:hypothetical protein